MPTRSHYTAAVDLPVPVEEAFAYHERPGCLSRLIPPWESVEIEHSDNRLSVGSRVVLRSRLFGVPFRWVAEHTDYDPPHRFADTQVSGPFAEWEHEHCFDRGPDDSHSRLTDRIRYRLPGGPLGRTLGAAKARETIEAMFAYRHRVTRDDLQLAARYRLPPKVIAISGSSGLVGSSLASLLRLLGHRVHPIVRSPSDDPDQWAVWSSESDAARLAEADVVIHLAGQPIAKSRWTDEVKKKIRDSRVVKTRQLCEALARLPKRPEVLISASASGYYGDRGEEALGEDSPPGSDFLADVAREWEAACQPAAEAGIRVVHPRFGLILSPNDGALAKMLTPAKLFGGALGSGGQWWSWIALDDVLGGIVHAIATEALHGPVNFVAPEPIHNRDFAATLGRVVGRPAVLPAPAIGLRLALGEMADALLLASTRLIPRRLQETGYDYRFTDLESALRYLLGKERRESIE